MNEYIIDSVVPYVYKELGKDGVEFFKNIYEEDGNFYSVHHGAGTTVRNMIRQGFPYLESNIGNLDDIYCDILLQVINYVSKPIEKVNRLDNVN